MLVTEHDASLTEAREYVEPQVLLLQLWPLQLHYQGQAEPGSAREVSETPADREPAQATLTPAGAGTRGGQSQ